MTLIKSISGIRGTIGGRTGDTLNPLDIVKFTSAYATFIHRSRRSNQDIQNPLKIVVGCDARISGEMVKNVVCGTLMGMGCDVINIGLATTPTTELAVRMSGADGGIIITASHNPRMWNALKLLNSEGEFLTAQDGAEVLAIAEKEDFEYADVDHLGHYTEDNTFDDRHVEGVLLLRLVDVEAIRKAKFNVCVDAINSVGALILPKLLDRLGVTYKVLNSEANGNFAHNPEPLEKNLTGIMDEMKSGQYQLGIVVDPDVDRLAFICEDGRMFGEEYTLVSVADYVLSEEFKVRLKAFNDAHGISPIRAAAGDGSFMSDSGLVTVSNLSSTRALRDVTYKYRGNYHAAAVGEVNVTTKMKEVGAIIGGEGNGGVIYPESHYGRDALVGIALFLSNLAHKGCTVSELRATYPNYYMAKNRIDLTPDTDVDAILAGVKKRYEGAEDSTNPTRVQVTDIDGVKIDYPESWVHLRKSNTEPIIRIYSEGKTPESAQGWADCINAVIKEIKH